MRAAFERWITLLIGVAVVALAIVAGAFLIDLTTSVRAGHPAQAGTSASSSPDTMQMGQAHIPTNNDCVLCHETGGTAGLKIVPAILHPVDGWRRCLTCHNDDTLGRTAPGHQGIAETECLNCHKVAQAGPAITQPHAALHDQHCLDCHGSVAHLPSSMASSKESACVQCHKPTDLPPPTYHHVADPRLSCRSLPSLRRGRQPADRPRPPRRLDLPALPRRLRSDAVGLRAARRYEPAIEDVPAADLARSNGAGLARHVRQLITGSSREPRLDGPAARRRSGRGRRPGRRRAILRPMQASPTRRGLTCPRFRRLATCSGRETLPTRDSMKPSTSAT